MNGVSQPGSLPRRLGVAGALGAASLVSAPAGSEDVAVLPASTYGSLGDEAMALALIEELRRRGRPATLLAYDDEQTRLFGSAARTIPIARALPGRLEAIGLVQVARDIRRFDALVFTAADVLDGAYRPRLTHRRIELVRLAANLGLATAIVGFSFRADPAPWAVDLLRSVPSSTALVARDDVSQQNASAAFGRDVQVAADLAFLLEPAPVDDPVVMGDLEWIRSAKARGSSVVGFSPNYLLDDLGLGSDRSFGTKYERAIDALLADTSAAVLIVPHDHRGEPSDFELARTLAQGRDPDRVRVSDVRCGAAQVKRLCGALDALVSARMHAGIAALGSGTPARIVDYQGKVAGLAKLVRIPELPFSPATFEDATTFSALVATLTPDRLAAERRTLAAVLPEVRRRSALNADAVGSRVG